MNCVVIEPNGDTRAESLNGFEDIRRVVGGIVEMIGIAHRHNAYLHEEGKLMNLPHNAKATALCHRFNAIFDDDFIVGPMVVVGPTDGNGEDTDISPNFAEWILTTSTEEMGIVPERS